MCAPNLYNIYQRMLGLHLSCVQYHIIVTLPTETYTCPWSKQIIIQVLASCTVVCKYKFQCALVVFCNVF